MNFNNLSNPMGSQAIAAYMWNFLKFQSKKATVTEVIISNYCQFFFNYALSLIPSHFLYPPRSISLPPSPHLTSSLSLSLHLTTFLSPSPHLTPSLSLTSSYSPPLSLLLPLYLPFATSYFLPLSPLNHFTLPISSSHLILLPLSLFLTSSYSPFLSPRPVLLPLPPEHAKQDEHGVSHFRRRRRRGAAGTLSAYTTPAT